MNKTIENLLKNSPAGSFEITCHNGCGHPDLEYNEVKKCIEISFTHDIINENEMILQIKALHEIEEAERLKIIVGKILLDLNLNGQRSGYIGFAGLDSEKVAKELRNMPNITISELGSQGCYTIQNKGVDSLSTGTVNN